jgi:glycosyltransferase involved in cell wall biosynthesis
VQISVIIPTHNPDSGRLNRTLTGLCAQSLPSEQWETIVVDNASSLFPDPAFFTRCTPRNFRILPEPTVGLTAARRCGLHAAKSNIIIFVDDDNVLEPNYLEKAANAFARLPRVGALGGKSLPEFSVPISADNWRREFFPLLALRDLGENELVSQGLRLPGADRNSYPVFAPIGAGMALRREAVQSWLMDKSNVSDRRGDELTSSGDNDIVLCVMKAGWEVAYSPALALTHLIPPSRVTSDYLARLNRGIQKSWTHVLAAHSACPWPPVSRWSVPLRILKAWVTYRAWTSPAAYIRWQGACGHFEGRAAKR